MKAACCCLSILALVSGCSTHDGPPELNSAQRQELVARSGAPLFEGMGTYHRKITTKDAGAQVYFNQGMVLAFGFNHAESIRSFKAAQRLDDQCAMCFWGEALATGPNINVTANGKAIMSPEDRKSAYAAITRAIELKSGASAAERDLIDALAVRYDNSVDSDRDPLDRAYAMAMRAYVERYPEDDDAAALFAEAWMNTMPWDYWSADGEPKPETVEVIAALEKTIARAPNHPLALHLYIHAVEASSNPGRAEAPADRLLNLVPGSGHLVHMPAHIFWRVGRYHDASEANVRAAAVDESYIAQCNAQGFYPAMYYPHNIHFLWAAATMEGRSAIALDAARKVAANVRLEQIEQFPTVEFFKTIPILALTQFGRWDDVLKEPVPVENKDYSIAIWHYARGTAMAHKKNLQGARAERRQLAARKDTVNVRFMDAADYPASTLLAIADELLQGDIALAGGEPEAAIRHFSRAVEIQDGLPYMEPPFWYYPTRQALGQALIVANKPAEAEAVYRKDLEDYPHNGWSMYGLIQSLEAQGRDAEASELRKMFEHAWSQADVQMVASRMP